MLSDLTIMMFPLRNFNRLLMSDAADIENK